VKLWPATVLDKRTMSQFSYKARRRNGELVEGVLDVADRPAAVAQIERLGLFPVAVDTAKAGAANSTQRPVKGVDLMAFLPPTLRAQLRQNANRSCRNWPRSRNNWRT